MGTVGANVGRLDGQLDQWRLQLDDLIAKADRAGSEVKADYHTVIADLKAKVRVAQAKLDELKAAGSEKAAFFKLGLDLAWAEVELTFKKLAS